MLKLIRLKTGILRKATNQLCNMSSISQVEQFADTLLNLKRKVEQTNSADERNAKRICPEVERVKKRKVALVLAYSGQGYLGLQRNPNQKTIEEDLLVALKRSNAINEDSFKQPQMIQFQRAARTDKGVSALRQIISLKLPEETKAEDINEHLPDQIRVIAIRRVTKGFNSKTSCDGRTYSYMLPTFALAPPEIVPTIDYRISKEIIDKINEIIAVFKGTHNFHNFTSKKKHSDPSAMRYMLSLQCSDPFVCDGMEFTTIYIRGQSFMLHQIRKMVGLTIAIARGFTTIATITKAYDAEKLDIPIAPGLGLVLEEAHYDRYNQRYGSDGLHEALDWSEYNSIVEEFKNKFILPSIVATEKEQRSMSDWLETLDVHSFDVRIGNHAQAQVDDDDDDDDEDDDDDDEEQVSSSDAATKSPGKPRILGGLAALEEAAKIVEAGTIDLDTLARVASDACADEQKKDASKTNSTETISR